MMLSSLNMDLPITKEMIVVNLKSCNLHYCISGDFNHQILYENLEGFRLRLV